MSNLVIARLSRLFAVAGVALALPAQVQLVKDINQGANRAPSSAPTDLTKHAGWLYFASDHETHGRELFRTQGTAANTQLVRDIRPGHHSASPSGLVSHRGMLFFAANDGISGNELWKTGGTAATTQRIADLRPGRLSSDPNDMVSLGQELLFTALDTAGVRRLFKTDGTSAGTTRVHNVGGVGLYTAGPFVWFRAGDGDRELWRTDGTASGTIRVYSASVYNRLSPVYALNGRYFFGGCIDWTTSALMISDGTPGGTRRMLTLPGSSGPCLWSAPPVHGVFNGRLWITVSNRQLWTSDGTVVGTKLVADLFSTPRSLAEHAGTVYFLADGLLGGLWKTDGTTAGTVLVHRTPGRADGLRRAQNRLWLTVDDNSGLEPWVSDGTSAGTMRLADVRPGQQGSDPSEFVELPGSAVAFVADDGTRGRELWTSLGTPGTTKILIDNKPPVRSLGSDVRFLGEHEGRVFFTADDGTHGDELWTSDGTSVGTQRLGDINPGPPSSHISQATIHDGRLYCTALVGSQRQLIESDGTPGGTRRLTSFASGVDHSPPFAHGGLVYFRARIASRPALHTFNPTTRSVQLLYRFSSANFWEPSYAPIGKTVFFVGADSARGPELWKTDGTPRGTLFVKETRPGTGHLPPHSLTAWRDKLFFIADSPQGAGLWVSNGVGSGTMQIVALQQPANLTTTTSRLFFTAKQSSYQALYTTEGTAATTKIVAPNLRVLGPPIAIGDLVVFPGNDTNTGVELWRSDGTTAGTQLVADIEPGAGDSKPSSLRPLGSRFVSFSATNQSSGRELWVTDGTSARTYRIEDLYTGPENGIGDDLRSALLAGGMLYFAGNDGLTGEELYRVDPGATAKSVGRPCGPAHSGMWASDPVIGGQIRVHGERVPPRAQGYMVVGIGPAGPFLDCFFHPMQTLALAPVTGPNWQQTYSIPNDPNALGVRLALQSWYVVPGSPRGFELSNAVDLRLGF